MNWLGMFDQKASKSSLLRGHDADADVDVFMRFAQPKPNDAILDLACGTGEISIALAAHGLKNITAVDQSERDLAAGQWRAARDKANVAFAKANSCRCPYPDATFDSVTMLGDSFARPNDFRQDTIILKEVLRLLRPGATFMLGVAEREHFMTVQHQANRWTYLGTGMTHKNFLGTVGKLSPAKRTMLEGVAPGFC